jgi:hypothetical protein
MNRSAFFLLSVVFFEALFSLNVSLNDANIVADKIWKNECAGSFEGLTNWKKGENFASLGIGHFIWYSKDAKENFQETFPHLLTFLKQEGAILPEWLKTDAPCPWNSRDEFYQAIQSDKMKSLRQFLYDTKNLQAIFMAKRLEAALPSIIENAREKEKVSILFDRLSKDPNGLYALLDYLNFKGSGTSPKETYKGQGWGLLQVIENIPASSNNLVKDFVESAKKTLSARAENSPPERKEKQWLKGWFNRLDTYLN